MSRLALEKGTTVGHSPNCSTNNAEDPERLGPCDCVQGLRASVAELEGQNTELSRIYSKICQLMNYTDLSGTLEAKVDLALQAWNKDRARVAELKGLLGEVSDRHAPYEGDPLIDRIREALKG